MATRPTRKRTEIPALRVKQWPHGWDRFEYRPEDRRRKPRPWFYLFSMNARELRLLAAVNVRQRKSPGIDIGIQRRHEESRSQEIARFVRWGYPYSILSEARRDEDLNNVLRKPGWLPTAIVVNILTASDRRDTAKVHPDDLLLVRDGKDAVCHISLPVGFGGNNWKLKGRAPLEVIDGQHRLFAFNSNTEAQDFDLPVVAFLGLDVSWQAYLFWTINIKPKKINPSLAFDLYPLLRTEDWLEIQDPFGVYRETRAQELVEALWSYPKSAWHERIDMLGERGRGFVSQASFVRSILATIIKRWEGPGVSIGGLFGGVLPNSQDPLPWSRPQQAAFLIFFWQLLRDAIVDSKSRWATLLRATSGEDKIQDPAFFGPHTLLNQDQGVRVVLHALNDLTFMRSTRLRLRDWAFEQESDPGDSRVIDKAIQSLRSQDIAAFARKLATALAAFDWRSANASSLTEAQRRDKLIYRGSGGYRTLRIDLLKHLTKSGDKTLQQTAKAVLLRMKKESG